MRLLGSSKALVTGTAIGLVLVLANSVAATETKTYSYDALGRLVSQVSDGTVNDDDARTYCYDPAGNRAQVVSDGSGVAADCSGGTSVPPANLAIGNDSATEGGTLIFTVTRSGNTSIAASANYTTVNGTATAPGDFTANSGTVSFSAGQTSKTITINTVDDSAVESSEAMTVVLSSPSSNATITDNSGTGTISDNDVISNSPPVAVNDTLGIFCGSTQVYDIISNDSDPDGDTLSLDSISFVSGNLQSLTIVSSTEIEVVAGYYNNSVVLSYVVEDPDGAQDTGTVSISVNGPARVCTE